VSEPIRQIPVRGAFVVKVPPGPARHELSALGRTRDIGRDNLVLVELGASAPQGDRTAWEQVLNATGGIEWAAPVLADDTSEPHVPTGDVTVRFERPPTPTQLKKFATDHGLTLRDKNEFVLAQFAFRPSSPRETYLPDLLKELQSAPDVERAWANTLSNYRRLAL
jgi:hypothetical protein